MKAAEDGDVTQQPTEAAAPVKAPVEFRYHADLRLLPSCPPSVAADSVSVAYRFAFADLSDARNKLPVSKISPSRFVNETPKKCCSGLALSMFQTLPQLTERAAKGIKHAPNFLKRVGDHYVQLDIHEYGRQGGCNGEGHFDFFEYTSFVYEQQVLAHARLAV
ncbi:MAG: hypothetical protein QM749_19725 [Aquabacterium sp.]